MFYSLYTVIKLQIGITGLAGNVSADLRDNSFLICLSQDVVAPESTTGPTPAGPAQAETLHRILT